MTEMRHQHPEAAVQTGQVLVPKFTTPRPTCHWEHASDGALAMVWSIAERIPDTVKLRLRLHELPMKANSRRQKSAAAIAATER